MRNGFVLRGIISLTIVFFITGCRHDMEEAWSDVAKNCAFSELNSDKALFFGPSNALGPGSVWRKMDSQDGGGYRVRWDSTSIPDSTSWIKAGREFDCEGKTVTKFSGSASAAFTTDLTPFSADVKSELGKAKNVDVKISMMRWDTILEGPFEQKIMSLPDTSPIKLDINKDGRLVMYRALLVRGFKAKLSFDTATAAALNAKLKDGVLKPINGDLGAALNVKWEKSEELTLTSVDDFYVAGELSKYSSTGFASSGSWFSPTIDVEKNAKVEWQSISDK